MTTLPANPHPEHLAVSVRLRRSNTAFGMPDVWLPALSISLVDGVGKPLPPPFTPTAYDVMLSYCDAESGGVPPFDRGGDGFVQAVHGKLLERGIRVYTFADRVRAGAAWQDVRHCGVDSCKVFIAVCSPTYASLDFSPWSANELRMAVASRTARGTPHILALWHSGDRPAKSDDVFCHQAGRPDAVLPAPGGPPGAACMFDGLVSLVQQLHALGVVPRANQM